MSRDLGSNPGGAISVSQRFDDKYIDFEKHTYKRTYKTSLTFEHVKEFLEYITLWNFSKIYILTLRSYFKKHYANKQFKEPYELKKYILRQPKGQRQLVKTARVYLRYCEQSNKLSKEFITSYREVLRVARDKADVYVPSNKEVLSNYRKIQNNSVYKIVYLVLATSGIRFVECLDFLKQYDSNKFTVHSNLVSYNVANTRHTKSINNIYLPLFVYNQLREVTNSYNSLRQKFKNRGCSVSLKYLRKWQYNFLLYNNVPESVADFIQGRVSKSISANHYLAKSQQATFWYAKLIPQLEKLFHNKQSTQKQYEDIGKTKIRQKRANKEVFLEVKQNENSNIQ